MSKKSDKKADRVRRIFELVNNNSRVQWEYVNQKGYDFSNDNQLTEEERLSLEEQGMPTFTINRIMPVVEMLNFYATANRPRWQAIGVEGSDVDVASVFSDVSDYIWDLSDGSSLYANCVNDSITKSIGFMQVSVDPNSDQGMGDVTLSNLEPFDVYVDPKSRDMLFKDASFILIRKILPKEHLMNQFPQFKTKIKKASGRYQNYDYMSEKSTDRYQKDFNYKDIDQNESINNKGENDVLVEYFELYEKIKVSYINVFYQRPPDPSQIQEIGAQVNVYIEEARQEMEVSFIEQQQELSQAVESGQMLPERMELELSRIQKSQQEQISTMQNELQSKLIQEATVIETMILSEKEFNIMKDEENFTKYIVDAVQYYGDRIKITYVVGEKSLLEHTLPMGIDDYPIIPFHYKWTGTPYPISAVSPLIGKQREINKSHQIMVHNASLGSSLRWMHEEGSVDTDYWEKYSSSPGALLPIRPGSTPPTAVQPAPLSNAFFSIVQEGKGDMEYLAGIYSSMMGDSGGATETYRGMLALDEYGTRRVKQWLNNSIEPALKQMGHVVKQFSQQVYIANKVFRIVQPNAITEEREVEINIPMYNDLGEAIGKFNDYGAAKFDVRIISGSTMPVNRWAYLSELKELMQLGVIDDIALLAETDIKNKEKIVERKSLYSQLQGQVSGLEEQLKNAQGTIETLERQVVQSGIKNKVMQASVEVNKKKEEVKSGMTQDFLETEAKQKLLQGTMAVAANAAQKEMQQQVKANKEKNK